MPRLAQYYYRAAAIFLLASIAMGLQMSISEDHSVAGAHAHLSLLGWLSCAVFGTYFALEGEKADWRLARLQFWIVVVSCAVMSGALYLLLLGYASMASLVAIASLAYALGAVMFLWIVFQHSKSVHMIRSRGV